MAGRGTVATIRKTNRTFTECDFFLIKLWILQTVISRTELKIGILTNPVTIPPKGVQTPLAALTADRPSDAVTGIEPTNDPTSWHEPRARIS